MPPNTAQTPTARPGVRYTVSVQSAHAHLFSVTLLVDQPAKNQRLSLPVWIPGSYLVREFSQHLQHLQATQGGEPVPLRQLDKNSWQVTADTGQALVLRYEVYAFDASVRTAFLDATRGFFNATSLCLRVIGQEDHPQTLDMAPDGLPAGWQVATGLRAVAVDAAGVGRYEAAHYDELADCPVELGTFWSGAFEACGVPHRFVVSGAGGWVDFDRLLALRAKGEPHKFMSLQGRYTRMSDVIRQAIPNIIGSPNAITHSSICAEADKFGGAVAEEDQLAALEIAGARRGPAGDRGEQRRPGDAGPAPVSRPESSRRPRLKTPGPQTGSCGAGSDP